MGETRDRRLKKGKGAVTRSQASEVRPFMLIATLHAEITSTLKQQVMITPTFRPQVKKNQAERLHLGKKCDTGNVNLTGKISPGSRSTIIYVLFLHSVEVLACPLLMWIITGCVNERVTNVVTSFNICCGLIPGGQSSKPAAVKPRMCCGLDHMCQCERNIRNILWQR